MVLQVHTDGSVSSIGRTLYGVQIQPGVIVSPSTLNDASRDPIISHDSTSPVVPTITSTPQPQQQQQQQKQQQYVLADPTRPGQIACSFSNVFAILSMPITHSKWYISYYSDTFFELNAKKASQ